MGYTVFRLRKRVISKLIHTSKLHTVGTFSGTSDWAKKERNGAVHAVLP